MPLCLTYLVTEVASSFYTKLNVGKEANVISIDLTLARHRRRRPPGTGDGDTQGPEEEDEGGNKAGQAERDDLEKLLHDVGGRGARREDMLRRRDEEADALMDNGVRILPHTFAHGLSREGEAGQRRRGGGGGGGGRRAALSGGVPHVQARDGCGRPDVRRRVRAGAEARLRVVVL